MYNDVMLFALLGLPIEQDRSVYT